MDKINKICLQELYRNYIINKESRPGTGWVKEGGHRMDKLKSKKISDKIWWIE